MRIFVLTLIVFLNFILSATWFRAFAFYGVLPDTALLIVVSFAILRNDVEASVLGFFAGLLYDIFYGRYVGYFALTYALTGFLCGKPFRDFFRENYLIPLGLAAIAALANGFAYYIIHFLILARTDFFRYIYLKILPQTIYAVVLAIPVYRLLYAVNNRLERFSARRR